MPASRAQAEITVQPMPAQDIRVEARPVVQDSSTLPAEIDDYFKSREKRLSIASALAVSHLARQAQRYVLLPSDFPDDKREQFMETLRRVGFRERDGMLVRGDTALYLQDMSEYKRQGFQAFYAWGEQNAGAEAEARRLKETINPAVASGIRVGVLNKTGEDMTGLSGLESGLADGTFKVITP